MGEEMAMADSCRSCCDRIRRWILASYQLSVADGRIMSSGLLARTEVCCLDCGHWIIVRIGAGSPPVAGHPGHPASHGADGDGVLRRDEPKPKVE